MNILLLLAWILLAMSVGWWAKLWSRNGLFWGVTSVLVSPVVGAIALLIVGSNKPSKLRDPIIQRCQNVVAASLVLGVILYQAWFLSGSAESRKAPNEVVRAEIDHDPQCLAALEALRVHRRGAKDRYIPASPECSINNWGEDIVAVDWSYTVPYDVRNDLPPHRFKTWQSRISGGLCAIYWKDKFRIERAGLSCGQDFLTIIEMLNERGELD